MSEMTNEEAIAIIRKEYLCVDKDCDIERSCGKCELMMPSKEPILEAFKMAMQALETIPKYKDAYNKGWNDGAKATYEHLKMCEEEQEPKTGHCKDCKWWKDSDGIYRRGIRAESSCPFNTKEIYEGDAFCYRFEPQERNDKE